MLSETKEPNLWAPCKETVLKVRKHRKILRFSVVV